jgi:hypothetical protein
MAAVIVKTRLHCLLRHVALSLALFPFALLGVQVHQECLGQRLGIRVGSQKTLVFMELPYFR